jgi:hypothetical protein
MKKALLVGAGLIFALSALARSYSLTDQPWRLKPFAGEPAPARLKYEFDESSWISQQQPVGNIAELKVGER